MSSSATAAVTCTISNTRTYTDTTTTAHPNSRRVIARTMRITTVSTMFVDVFAGTMFADVIAGTITGTCCYCWYCFC